MDNNNKPGRKPGRKKGGRPTIDNKKNIVKTYKVTAEEESIIQRKAEEAGLTISAFVRECALGKEIKQGISREHMDSIKLLRSFGNNLNQIAKKINSMSPTDKIGVQIMINLDEISSMISMVKKNIDIKGRGGGTT
ncbi:plasmid mobilization relaxosome protein MobC [Ekhidna sp.]|uniref:plasmid mobilization protein n=1 Tax=Ekhidna sp. TaxID=2608089 RepID=UPI003298C648